MYHKVFKAIARVPTRSGVLRLGSVRVKVSADRTLLEQMAHLRVDNLRRGEVSALALAAAELYECEARDGMWALAGLIDESMQSEWTTYSMEPLLDSCARDRKLRELYRRVTDCGPLDAVGNYGEM
jgi:hypothetical protein